MKITKLGHCCLVIEEGGIKILTDPGSFTNAQDVMTDIDIVLVTHEHQDHFHTDSMKALVRNNPSVTVVTNTAVASLMQKEDIATPVAIVGDGESAEVKGVKIEGFGKDHAPVYQTMGLVENTGYMVAGKFYFPGDNFYNPGRPIDILALPVAGPWMKLSDAINFAKEVKARVAIGVHDGMITPNFRGLAGIVLKSFVSDTPEF